MINECKKRLADFMNNHESVIENMYYEADYEEMDMSGIGNPDNWKIMEYYDAEEDAEDPYAYEINSTEYAFDLNGEITKSIDEHHISKKYAFTYIGSLDSIAEDEMAFYVLVLKNGNIEIGDFCGD